MLGQDSLPNIAISVAETSGKQVRCFTRTLNLIHSGQEHFYYIENVAFQWQPKKSDYSLVGKTFLWLKNKNASGNESCKTFYGRN